MDRQFHKTPPSSSYVAFCSCQGSSRISGLNTFRTFNLLSNSSIGHWCCWLVFRLRPTLSLFSYFSIILLPVFSPESSPAAIMNIVLMMKTLMSHHLSTCGIVQIQTNNTIQLHEVCVHFWDTLLKLSQLKQFHSPPVGEHCPEIFPHWWSDEDDDDDGGLHSGSLRYLVGCVELCVCFQVVLQSLSCWWRYFIALVAKHKMWCHCCEVFEVLDTFGVVKYQLLLWNTQIWKPWMIKCPFSFLFFYTFGIVSTCTNIEMQ